MQPRGSLRSISTGGSGPGGCRLFTQQLPVVGPELGEGVLLREEGALRGARERLVLLDALGKDVVDLVVAHPAAFEHPVDLEYVGGPALGFDVGNRGGKEAGAFD